MRLRTQIILKLVLIIFLLFAIYMVVLIIIFELYYKPDVFGHFKTELEQVHNQRTSNMTVSIASRFETFDNLTSNNVGKMVKLLSTTYQRGNKPLNEILPFEWREGKDEKHCTTYVEDENQQIMLNFYPLWTNLLKLKLGWQADLEIYSIIVFFEGEGLCVFYRNDTE
jgi:hypothetical protein